MKKSFIYSLTFRITVVICLLILPINILIIILSNYMINSIEEELITSYRTELAIYMTKIDENITEIDRYMRELVSENWSDLSEEYDKGKANIAKYRFWEKLVNIREEINIVEIAYLKTNWDKDVRTTYNNQINTYLENQVIADYLKNTDMKAYSPSEYEKITIGDTHYLLDNMNLHNYSFGVLININGIILPMEEMKAFPNEKIYLADQEGNIISERVKWQVDLNKNMQEIVMDGTKKKYMVISYPSKTSNYEIIRILSEEDKKSAIPYLERSIQIIAFFSIIIVPLLWFLIHKMVLRPLHILDEGMRQIEAENLEYRIENKNKTREFKHLYGVFNNMSKRIKTLTIEAYERDIEKLEIETTNLRLQMNPHMLLNSLNMIYSLAQSKNYHYIKKFSLHLVEYFRYVLRKNDILVSIKSEMDFVKNYLEIQKIRFPNVFTCVYDIDEKLYDVPIPPLMIQNFVENSIKYGLKMESEIEILIVIRTDGTNMSIAICDTGNGIKKEILECLRRGEPIENNTGRHIGIWNCRRRLKIFYGEKAKMTISSVINEGTQVWIELPMIIDENEAFRNKTEN